MPKIYDNIENPFITGLKETLKLSQRIDCCIGYFNLRGWRMISKEIDQLSGEIIHEKNQQVHRVCRLLVGMQKMPVTILRESFYHDDEQQMDQNEAIRLKKQLAEEFKQQLTIGLPTEQDERGLRRLSRQLKAQKVVVKLHLKHPLHAKLYLAYSTDQRIPVLGFLGSSNLTFAGLVKQGELNVDVLEQDAANKLAKWFEERWLDRWCIDITKELIEIIDNSWATERLIPPFHVYLKIAYHLSTEARAGINEFKLPKIFEKDLLEFQQKAVSIAAKKLHKRNGVVIGDVVGLGKTIIASAISKLFEEDFSLETLIICPKNLVEMWKDYKIKYRLNAEIISQSNVQKILPTLRRYRIVIIDESHNLRNDQGTRYKAIKSYLEENESKIILLSATPYNKSYLDLANQLRLFIPDDQDLGITPEKYIQSLGGIAQFNAKHPDIFIKSIRAFQESHFSDDWRDLMRLYLVRRTRSFIKNNYTKTNPETGRKYLTFSNGKTSYFPDRIPKKIEYIFNANDPDDQYAKLYSTTVVDIINKLELPRYGLGNFLAPKLFMQPTKEEEQIIRNLSRAGKRLMGFCRTNLFKRLESSGYAFLLSLSRHILRNYIYIYAIQQHLRLPIGNNIVTNLDDYLEDDDLEDDEQNQALQFILEESLYLEKAKSIYHTFEIHHSKQFKWIRSAFFAPTLLDNLLNDSKEILSILKLVESWNTNEDKQLNILNKLLNETHLNDKILVFTQFADTAKYLEEQLKKRGMINMESVTGHDKNPTEKAHRFSPKSNGKGKIANELRVLISTDVLSEGQNLQDAHIIVNYDLPWAIIRLIQRAGRVDRIGQMAEQIFCYSFLPEEGIEKIIGLRERLKTRIQQNADVVGSDEVFFEGDPINLADLYSENSEILEHEEQDEEVDLSSYAYQIWKNATDKNPELKKIVPDLPHVTYTTKQNTFEIDQQGVIVYLKTTEDNDALAWIDTQGNIITQSQLSILKAVQCLPETKPLLKLSNHHELVDKATVFLHEEEKNQGGALGRKTGIKSRVYLRLKGFCEDNDQTLLVNDMLKKAVELMLKHPLKERAKESLNRQLKVGISDEQLGALVISLQEEEKLVILNDNADTMQHSQLICSMGLRN